MIARAAVLVVLSISVSVSVSVSTVAVADDRLEPDDLPAPPAEVVRGAAAVELPAVPALDPPRPPEPEPVPEPAVATGAPLRKAVDERVRNVSIALLNACNRAIAARRFADAITECRAAVTAWDGNHLAWYGWANAELGRRSWAAAATAIARAVALRPDRAMYQLHDGVARYHAAVDPAALDAARDSLLRAIRLEPGLWRAHYYLGRIDRDRGDARRAAEQFTRAIAGNPGHQPSYVALCELYRSRDQLDAALAVALRGTERLRATEAADLWVEAGAIYGARGLDDPAVAAFGKALEIRPCDADARLQRGVASARRGDFAGARSDLDDIVQSTEPELEATRQVARQLLDQLAQQERRATREQPPQGSIARRLITPRATQP